MIPFFPVIYPDELMFSVISRYHQQSAMPLYVSSIGKIHLSGGSTISIELVNPWKREAAKFICQDKGFFAIILEHTMFPYYVRFLPLSQKQHYMDRLIHRKTAHQLIGSINRQTDVYLKYCPLCVKEDRKLYGETYWHRVHQIPYIEMCPKHGCPLKNGAATGGKRQIKPVTAEDVADEMEEGSMDQTKWDFAIYLSKLLTSNLGNDFQIKELLKNKMGECGYLCPDSNFVKVRKLLEDYRFFYNKSGIYPAISEEWQISSILTGKNRNPTQVCQLAFFLKIPAEHFIAPMGKGDSIHEEINQRLRWLRRHDGEWTRNHFPQNKKPTRTRANWDIVDDESLPLVKDMIQEFQGNEEVPPKRISIYSVEKALQFPKNRIRFYLPKCRTEIEQYVCSKDVHIAIRLQWAIQYIQNHEIPMNLNQIKLLTSIQKPRILECYQTILSICEPEIVAIVNKLLDERYIL